jgi:carbon starvation protein CstA
MASDLLQKEYDSILSEISETCRAPEKWASVLIAFSTAIIALYKINSIKSLIILSLVPILYLIMIIYLSIITIEHLSEIKSEIAKEMKNQGAANLSEGEEELAKSCMEIKTDNLKSQMWLISIFFSLFYVILIYSLF